MLREILPESVVVVEVHGDDPSAYLHPEEAAQLGVTAVERRVGEFKLGRTCARRALSKLGLAPTPVLRGQNREPLWPIGVVGSISHCSGYCAAAVAMQADCLSLGIDAEVHDLIPDGVLEQVASDRERAWIEHAPAGIHWDRLLFSAKESVYKAWYPLTGGWLNFSDVSVIVEPRRQLFRARLISTTAAASGQPTEFTGQFRVQGGHLFTAVVLPA